MEYLIKLSVEGTVILQISLHNYIIIANQNWNKCSSIFVLLCILSYAFFVFFKFGLMFFVCICVPSVTEVVEVLFVTLKVYC